METIMLSFEIDYERDELYCLLFRKGLLLSFVNDRLDE